MKAQNSSYSGHPFGMQMPGRSNSYGAGVEYRYAYNGMELDNEVSGTGNSYTTEFRQYDPRLARWKSLDPLMAQFPWMSPYVAFDNNPVFYVDPYGLASEVMNDGDGDKNKKSTGANEGGGAGDKGGRLTSNANILKEDGQSKKVGGLRLWWIKNQNKNVKDASDYSDKTGGELSLKRNSQGKWDAQVTQGYVDKEGDAGVMCKRFDNPIVTRSTRGNLDGTVFSFLPWYNIARGIQDVQSGDNWGWFKIGMEVVPLGVFGKGMQLLHKAKVTKLVNSVIQSAARIDKGKTARGIQALSKKVGRNDRAYAVIKKVNETEVNNIIRDVIKSKNQYVNITRNQQGIEVIDIFNRDSGQGVRLIKETGAFDTFINYVPK